MACASSRAPRCSSTGIQQRNLREIADKLGVPLILEGSVRRVGDDLRLTLQLIDGRTDEHLWAETYDRKFDNALRLQRTVAQQIVASIGAKLTPTEDHLIERSAPTDPEAYGFYLQALSHWSQLAKESELRTAEGLLSRAVELDPAFALGYALRARVRVWLGTTVESPNAETDVQGAWLDIERAFSCSRSCRKRLRPALHISPMSSGIRFAHCATWTARSSSRPTTPTRMASPA